MEKRRSEIEVKDKWKLEDIYATDQVWEAEYPKAIALIDKLPSYQNTFLNSGADLLAYLEADEQAGRLLEKLYVYASMRSDEDKTNNQYLNFYGKAQNLYSRYQEATAFVIPSMMQHDYQEIEAFMKDEPKLKEHEIVLKDIYRFQKHTLTKEEEKIIASFSKVLSSSDETASVLSSSDLEFGMMKNEKGEEVSLTESSYSILIRSKDREVRKQAFQQFYQVYNQFSNTFASTLSATVEAAVTEAKLRGYESSLQASLYADDVAKEVYQNLIKTTKEHLKPLFEYYKMKQELLGVDALHIYDIYTPLIGKSDKTYSFDEAKELVIKALGVLGEEYITQFQKAFTEGWIDIYPNKGKRSGAYSGGSYDTKPYVLLNYNGKLDDVSTLAHELGHSMHSYYTRTNNPYDTGDYAIFVAEVASTVNELLLNRYLLEHTTDKTERLAILNNLLELFKGTIYRQTMFAEFEMLIHEKVEQGEILTSELLSSLYLKLNHEYFGEDVVVDEEIQYEWTRIPHFYTPFYVYKYATGLSAACHIVTDILAGKEHARENYITFLKSGSQKHPLELLKIAGVDMNDPAVIESAIAMFQETLDEFQENIQMNK